MSNPHVLLLGGHGKISQLLTPLLLAKSWSVTSVIRSASQRPAILALANNTPTPNPGNLSVLVASLDDVKSPADATPVLLDVKPDYVIWCAGAGGKGGKERTYAVDRDAAKAYISAAAGMPRVTKFLMVSYTGSRKGRAMWWSDEDWAASQHVNEVFLPDYAKAKMEADEHLAAVAEARRKGGDEAFQAICLRPGTLTDGAGTGKVKLGRTAATGKVARADVAVVALALLERRDTRGWYDLLEGEDGVDEAVEKCVVGGWNGMDGEDMERIYARPL